MDEGKIFDEILQVVDSCLPRIGWRLRPQSKPRRLSNGSYCIFFCRFLSLKRQLSHDILALCTGMRSVVVVDYADILPKLQIYLIKLLYQARKDLVLLKPLRVMIISDMVYLINVKGLAELALSSLRSPSHFHLLDFETHPPKILASNVEGNTLASALVQIQKKFSEAFPVRVDENLPYILPNKETKLESKSELELELESLCFDLNRFTEHFEVSLASLNGWLLGYPVTYLYSVENMSKATMSISMQDLHIYKIYISRNQKSGVKHEHELMSFTVPRSMSKRGEREPWAKEFLARMREKLETTSNVWGSIWMNVESWTLSQKFQSLRGREETGQKRKRGDVSGQILKS